MAERRILGCVGDRIHPRGGLALAELRSASAWRFFLIWAVLGVGVFVLAGYLTRKITSYNPYVEQDDNAQEIGLYSPIRPGKPLRVRFLYDEAEGRTSSLLSLQYDEPLTSARIYISNLRHDDTCLEEGDIHQRVKAKLQPDRTYLIDWVPRSGSAPLSLVCEVSTAAIRFETFTARQIHFFNSAFADSGPELQPVSWRFAVPHLPGSTDVTLEEVHLKSRRLLDWRSAQEVAPGGRLVLSWHSQARESLRDIIIVIIGSLVALGAAMLLEALRPFVDHLAGR